MRSSKSAFSLSQEFSEPSCKRKLNEESTHLSYHKQSTVLSDQSTSLGLSRSPSESSFESVAPAQPPCSEKQVALEAWAVDCPHCRIAIDPNGLGIGHLAHLAVTFIGNRMVTQYSVRPMFDAMDRALQCLARSNASFVISYDMRNCMPGPQLARALREIHHKYPSLFVRQLRSIALLVQDNLFTIAGRSKVDSFMTDICLPACPRAIVHNEMIAKHYFRDLSGYSPEALSPFVSLVGVRDAGINGSVANLLHLRQPQDKGADIQYEPMMHVLANGDVRVIQSGAHDIMLSHMPQKDGVEVDGPKVPDEEPSNRCHGADFDVQGLKALRYPCSAEKLEAFVDIYFHIGELTMDSDAVSGILKGPRIISSSDVPTTQEQVSAKPQGDSSKRPVHRDFPQGIWALCLRGIAKIFDA
jgi:hypothetical protein